MVKQTSLKKGDTSHGDLTDIDQKWDEGSIRERYEAWLEYWNEGTKFGIVGGSPLKSSITPDTVIAQVNAHGTSDVSRKGTAFTGLGALVGAIHQILDNTVITEEEINKLKEEFSYMKQILTSKDKNPQNIPFTTVIEFHPNKDDPKKPRIVRGKVRGHYRTEAYNEYVKWAKKYKKNFKGKLAQTDDSWYAVGKGGGEPPTDVAKPPLYLAIADKNRGIMGIVQTMVRNLKDIEVTEEGGHITTFHVSVGHAGDLHLINSVASFIKNEVIKNPSIYQRGTSRAPVKNRLHAMFNDKVFGVGGQKDVDALKTIIKRGHDVAGLNEMLQFKLSFPTNNKVINKLIKNVLGEKGMASHQKPNTVSDKGAENYAPRGLVLKSWQRVLKRGMN